MLDILYGEFLAFEALHPVGGFCLRLAGVALWTACIPLVFYLVTLP